MEKWKLVSLQWYSGANTWKHPIFSTWIIQIISHWLMTRSSLSFSCSLMISFLNHVKTCPIMMISCWCEESSWWWYLIFTFANYSWVQMIYEFTNHCIMRIESWGELCATMCSHSMNQWISLSSLISCRVNCCASYVKMNFNEVICSCLHKT